MPDQRPNLTARLPITRLPSMRCACPVGEDHVFDLGAQSHECLADYPTLAGFGFGGDNNARYMPLMMRLATPQSPAYGVNSYR